MIKTNLCPIDELENPYWYLPDVLILVFVGIITYTGVTLYFDSIVTELNETQEKISSLQASTNQLAPDLERFKSLDFDVNALSQKLKALQKITVSKMEKYTPIIVLEHIQNLKPQGVWYTEFSIKNAQTTEFSLKGIAFDNIMTAELLTSIRATASSEVDPTDLRSLVFFDKLSLIETAIAPGPPPSLEGTTDSNLVPPSSFDIKGIILERSPAANDLIKPAPQAPTSTQILNSPESNNKTSNTLQYARRAPTP